MARVVLRSVRKSFGNVETIRGVDLDIADGELVVLVGPSGCGKSTLLRMIAGLEDISSGELMISDVRANQLPPAKRGVAMVFQSYALYPHMTVFQNMAFGLSLAGKNRGEIEARVNRTAETLRISNLLHRKPRELSGGQRQRVAIGRAMVREPRVFLLDEPLSNLDAALRVQMRIEIAKLHSSLKTTMIYVTHDQVEAMTLADRIVVLNNGLVEQVGEPLELYHHPRNTFVAGFIGSPKINFLQVNFSRIEERTADLALPGGGTVRLFVRAKGATVGERATLGIRPENLEVVGDAADANATLSGEVVMLERFGNESFAHLDMPGAHENLLTVRLPANSQVREGNRLRLTIAHQHVHLFDQHGLAFPKAPTIS